MNRYLIPGAAAVAALAIAVPTAVALAGSPSFSERVPVRVPSQAAVVSYDDSGHAVVSTAPRAATNPSAVPTPTRSAEPGDDHGGDRTRTGTRTRSAEPGDDHGGDRTRTRTPSAEPGDDNGGRSGRDDTTRSAGSDDGGHRGGHGSDD